MSRKFREKELIIASHNQGKIEEITALLSAFSLKLESARSLNLPVPEENGDSYLENALLKAKAAVKATNRAVLADDSGLELSALNGAPGLDTAPFTDAHGGHQKVFQLWQKRDEILRDPRAYFVCFQVLAWPDGHCEYFSAKIKGTLSFPPRGENGHGYDPIFVPDGYHKTVAEMDFEEKHACGHRLQALQKLIECCLI